MPERLKCMFCSYTTFSIQDLLDHEDKEHGKMVEELEGVDGNEHEEDITGEEPEEED
jgi:hypothetical protein